MFTIELFTVDDRQLRPSPAKINNEKYQLIASNQFN